MRLKTRELLVDVPLEDGAVITVRKVPQDVYFATIHPINAIIFSDADSGLTSDEQKKLFNERITNMMATGDTAALQKIQDAMCFLFGKMVAGWSGIEDEDDNPLEATPDNIELVKRMNPSFCCDLVTAGLAAIEAKEAELAKN